jgi:hypothetical protein
VFSHPVDLTIDDEVTFETGIRVESIVMIVRKGERSVSIGAISAESPPSTKYVVRKGDARGVIEFSLWKERD